MADAFCENGFDGWGFKKVAPSSIELRYLDSKILSGSGNEGFPASVTLSCARIQ